MDLHKKMAIFAGVLIVGVVLFSLSLNGIIAPIFNGLGAALAAVAVLKMYGYYRYSTDAEYAKRVDIEQKDERNNSLSKSAAKLTLIIGLIALLAVGFILQLFNLGNYAAVCFYIICAFVILYIGLYFYLRHKK